ncbi:MAG: hypothetical protein Q9223_007795 [Gallowayella weberi]
MPTEIITEVFAALPKSDLKSVRLVCRRFDAIVQPILFDKLVISNVHSNGGLLREVVDKGKLANHVKTLVLDVPRFRNVTLGYYLQYLVRQIAEDLRARQSNPVSLKIPSSLKQELDLARWFQDPGSTHEREELLAVFGKDILSGYERYMEHSRTQDDVSSESDSDWWRGCFWKCPNIQRLEVQTEWQAYPQQISHKIKSLLPVYLSSGYVARHWNPVFLRPEIPARYGWDSGPFLWDLFTTLSNAHKPIRNVIIGKGCEIRFRKFSHDGLQRIARSILTVFEHLTSLAFWFNIEAFGNEESSVKYIGPALNSARNLRYLRLGANRPTHYSYAELARSNLLPLLKDCVWPELVELELFSMTASADSYLKLLRDQKSLKSLTLGSIDLQEDPSGLNSTANVKRFVEGLRSSLNLTAFSIKSPWTTRSASDVWEGFSAAGGNETRMELERYVVHGGTAPFAMLD